MPAASSNKCPSSTHCWLGGPSGLERDRSQEIASHNRSSLSFNYAPSGSRAASRSVNLRELFHLKMFQICQDYSTDIAKLLVQTKLKKIPLRILKIRAFSALKLPRALVRSRMAGVCVSLWLHAVGTLTISISPLASPQIYMILYCQSLHPN